MNKLEQAALKYAANGWPVFPCNQQKRPLTKNGFKDATTDQRQIIAWWAEHPDAAIGVPTGKAISAWVLDVDLPDGPATVKAWEEKHGLLPKTLSQQTGSGGFHFFFHLPDGLTIKNNAKKIGPGLDVRSDGGYVLVSPSSNEVGQYKWQSREKLANAPQWLLDKVLTTEAPVKRTITGPTSHYGESALAKELAALSSANPGERNHQLNASAFSLGQLISGGELDQAQAEIALTGIGQALGLNQGETAKTIESGLKAGMNEPRSAPKDLEYIADIPSIPSIPFCPSDSVRFRQIPSDSVKTRQVPSDSVGVPSDSVSDKVEIPGKKISELVTEWVMSSSGSFTSFDIDRDFGFSTRTEKKSRNDIVQYLLSKNKILRDKNKKGKYHVVVDDIEEVNWLEDHAEEFPLFLPLGLDKIVSIGPRNIILLEGCTNAGKTIFCLDTLARNLKAEYPLWYLFSEGSPGEVKKRLTNGKIDLEEWAAKVHAAPRSSRQDQVIKMKNPDGLTIVDFLEPPNSDYFRLGTQISDIWESLGKGVALICIQKKTGAPIGRGGEAIREKPRLAMTLDLLEKRPQYIICALKIEKCKTPKVAGSNPDGKEIHFAIAYGCDIYPLTEWGYYKEEQRNKMLAGHVAEMQSVLGLGDIDQKTKKRLSYAFEFAVTDGTTKGLNFTDVEKWKEAYPLVNVESELKMIHQRSKERPWLDAKSWFFTLNGLLAKQNQKMISQAEQEPFIREQA